MSRCKISGYKRSNIPLQGTEESQVVEVRDNVANEAMTNKLMRNDIVRTGTLKIRVSRVIMNDY